MVGSYMGILAMLTTGMLLFTLGTVGVVSIAEVLQLGTRWESAGPRLVGTVPVIVLVTEKLPRDSSTAGLLCRRRVRGNVEVLLPETAARPAAIGGVVAAAFGLLPSLLVLLSPALLW